MSQDVLSGATGCPRCGGAHTARQRCPLDAPPPAPTGGPQPPTAPSAEVPPIAAPSLAASAQFAVWKRAAAALPSPLPALVRPVPRRPALRIAAAWLFGAIGTVVLLGALTAAGSAIAALTQVGTDTGRALAIVFISIAVGAAAMALMFLAARAYAKVVFALLSVFLVTAGFLLMAFAPVARQMDTPELAEYTAFQTLLWFGAAALVAGVALGAQCVRWALRPRALATIAGWSRLLAAVYGVAQGMSGLFLAFALLTLINRTAAAGDSIAARAITVAVAASLALVPGVILTFHAISSMMGEGSGQFRAPVAWRWLAVWGAVLLAGGLAMAQDPPVAWPMPVLHVAAAALPGVVLVALIARASWLAGRPVRGLTWRQVMLAAAITMSLGVTIAVYVESIGDLGAVVLMLVHHGAFRDAVWDQIGRSDEILTRNEQFVANLVAAAVVAPLIEEFAKGLGVRFTLRRYNTAAQAMVLGAAAGAAFGFVEAQLYGLAGATEDPGTWWLALLLRGGSTSLHVFNTSLVALAWWHWSFGKRPRLGALLFATAVVVHALWNGLLVTLSSRIFGLETLSERAVEVIAYALVSVIAVTLVGALPLIARRLREAPPMPVAGTPLAGMRAWLG